MPSPAARRRHLAEIAQHRLQLPVGRLQLGDQIAGGADSALDVVDDGQDLGRTSSRISPMLSVGAWSASAEHRIVPIERFALAPRDLQKGGAGDAELLADEHLRRTKGCIDSSISTTAWNFCSGSITISCTLPASVPRISTDAPSFSPARPLSGRITRRLKVDLNRSAGRRLEHGDHEDAERDQDQHPTRRLA